MFLLGSLEIVVASLYQHVMTFALLSLHLQRYAVKVHRFRGKAGLRINFGKFKEMNVNAQADPPIKLDKRSSKKLKTLCA